ncbi:MAG: hypothetical protein JSW09_00095 [Pseudomonadota bacterium]|nr:MAG: hypothetical protein JSW09_00095 [Pseudomonadota bacterium]
MAKKPAARRSIKVNRAPVLTLWAAVVAERLGFQRAEALTLGRAVAGLNAYSKGVSLGLFKPTPKEIREQRRKLRAEQTISVDLLHRAVPAKQTPDGLRAVSKGTPIKPDSVERYLEGKFGDALADVRRAMTSLARAFTPAELATRGYTLYTKFRPAIPEGKQGWGAAGTLSLARIRGLAQ